VLVLADDRGSVAAVVNSAACLEAEAVREALRKLLTSGEASPARADVSSAAIIAVPSRSRYDGGRKKLV